MSVAFEIGLEAVGLAGGRDLKLDPQRIIRGPRVRQSKTRGGRYGVAQKCERPLVFRERHRVVDQVIFAVEVNRPGRPASIGLVNHHEVFVREGRPALGRGILGSIPTHQDLFVGTETGTRLVLTAIRCSSDGNRDASRFPSQARTPSSWGQDEDRSLSYRGRGAAARDTPRQPRLVPACRPVCNTRVNRCRRRPI
jgi:hypothetical protein